MCLQPLQCYSLKSRVSIKSRIGTVHSFMDSPTEDTAMPHHDDDVFNEDNDDNQGHLFPWDDDITT